MSEPHPTSESEIVELIRSIDVRAPDSLHDAVDTMIAERSSSRRRSRSAEHAEPAAGGSSRRAAREPRGETRAARRAAGERPYSLRPRLAALGAIAAAVIALAVVVGTSGHSSTLSVHDAFAPTLRAATAGPPAESSSNRTELAASVDGVAFPYWGTHFGWRSTGTRTDTVDGRTITTVFYEGSRGRRVGYAIVAGSAPSQITGGVVERRDGTAYRLLTIKGAPVVAWMREGHLCIVSGHGVDGATLLRLASWDERRAQAS